MHVPDGFLSTSVVAGTYAASGATAAVAFRKLRQKISEERIPLLGVTAAFIFAAQMINFPVANGTSGHLIGGLLAALVAGPWGGFLIMLTVLLVQAFLFADGGITALGANVFNMAFIGSVVAYYIYLFLFNTFKNTKLAIVLSAWLSVELAAAACAVELALSGTIPLGIVLPAMLFWHALIGAGEAVITAGVIAAVEHYRPDLLAGEAVSSGA